MAELVSWAGSAEGVSAAVQSGADAVIVGFGIGEKRGRLELSEDELGRAAQFCRVRGVKLYVAMDVLPTDDALPLALEKARRAARMGADALMAEDIGLIWALRRAVPSMPLHGGTGLGIHDRDGLRLCASMGLKRVALPPHLTKAQLEGLCKDAPLELEAQVHGPLCPAVAGTCRLTDFEEQPGGQCRWECVSRFAPAVGTRRPLALKDLCLVDELEFLQKAGLAALRIDGRDRRPEYVAAVTGVYTRALGTGRKPSGEDRALLKDAYPAAGFTAGALSGADYGDMLGMAQPEPEGDTPFYTGVRKNYLNHEFQRVEVDFEARLSLGSPFTLTVRDDRGNVLTMEGEEPELAFHTATTPAMLQTELFKTGGTPYRCGIVSAAIAKGVWLDPAKVAPVRDALLKELTARRMAFEPRSEGSVPELPPPAVSPETPVLTVSVLKADQLTPRLLSLAPPVVYLPLEEAVSGNKRLEPYLASEHIAVCAQLPPVIAETELGRVAELLFKARQLGIGQVSVSNVGHIVFCRKLGFEVRGEPGLNVRSSYTLAVLAGLRLKSAALRGDMTARDVRALKKYTDTELTVYGREALMETSGCLVRAQTGACSCDSFTGLTGDGGFTFPVTRAFGCRNTLWSGKKLHLASRSREYLTSGLWGVRLCFTTENPEECARVAERYLELGTYEPQSVTNGKY